MEEERERESSPQLCHVCALPAQALSIYVHKLKNPKMAVEYCAKAYRRDDEYAKDVYVDLLQIFLVPQDKAASSGGPTSSETFEPNINAALNILRTYPDKIDTQRALALLPPTTQIADVHGFLKTVLQDRSQTRRTRQLLKNLTKAERLQVNEELLHYSSRRVVIDDDRVCQICHKPIRTSAFVCHANGTTLLPSFAHPGPSRAEGMSLHLPGPTQPAHLPVCRRCGCAPVLPQARHGHGRPSDVCALAWHWPSRCDSRLLAGSRWRLGEVAITRWLGRSRRALWIVEGATHAGGLL